MHIYVITGLLINDYYAILKHRGAVVVRGGNGVKGRKYGFGWLFTYAKHPALRP